MAENIKEGFKREIWKKFALVCCPESYPMVSTGVELGIFPSCNLD
ncbi:hypothetical protein Mpsy_1729 [Methanolobus psychrophilus R15]|nr:hypothetical protein Mpsy_1729 [Methanolobus psychrophilus R15]